RYVRSHEVSTSLIWSALTCQRFGLQRPGAAISRWIQPNMVATGRDRPKALTGQLTPNTDLMGPYLLGTIKWQTSNSRAFPRFTTETYAPSLRRAYVSVVNLGN